jgi:ATP-dependent DNA helicase RecQ
LVSEVDLLTALRRYWGYEAFRPRQQQIVTSILTGHDVAVIMPTGGGKSLCYQLPAAISSGTAVIISPLIALMHDQAMHLAQMGIPSAILNSTITSGEQSRVMRDAVHGAYRLIYLSPERLARADTIGWLQRVPVSFFAIDEAHCISEWGHEFRPEYRRLSALRETFPGKPIAAFTASATQQVRHDILRQLKLQDPHKYILSFQRPNLRYVVKATDSKTQPRLLISALRQYQGENVIVYAPTIASVGETVERLHAAGIPSLPYHGKMENAERKRNQEIWMSEEVPVLVGTIAFGLGINKPSVRAVIHLSMPKSVEQYYQEAGRAGRDGLPADCVLLWRKQDAGLIGHFISEMQDANERANCWRRYRFIREYVESERCRHRQICVYFGETPKWEGCGLCDACGSAPEWLSGKKSALREPLAPASIPERIPSAVVTPQTPNPPVDMRGVDPALVKHMKKWRFQLATARGLPPFIIMHDSTLVDLCKKLPGHLDELLEVSGIGERKAELYGAEILQALRAYHSR